MWPVAAKSRRVRTSPGVVVVPAGKATPTSESGVPSPVERERPGGGGNCYCGPTLVGSGNGGSFGW